MQNLRTIFLVFFPIMPCCLTRMRLLASTVLAVAVTRARSDVDCAKTAAARDLAFERGLAALRSSAWQRVATTELEWVNMTGADHATGNPDTLYGAGLFALRDDERNPTLPDGCVRIAKFAMRQNCSLGALVRSFPLCSHELRAEEKAPAPRLRRLCTLGIRRRRASMVVAGSCSRRARCWSRSSARRRRSSTLA